MCHLLARGLEWQGCVLVGKDAEIKCGLQVGARARITVHLHHKVEGLRHVGHCQVESYGREGREVGGIIGLRVQGKSVHAPGIIEGTLAHLTQTARFTNTVINLFFAWLGDLWRPTIMLPRVYQFISVPKRSDNKKGYYRLHEIGFGCGDPVHRWGGCQDE